MGHPFARAAAMFALIAQAMASSNPGAAMAQIPAYVSRGKGQARRQASDRCVAHDKRAACKARNRARHRARAKA